MPAEYQPSLVVGVVAELGAVAAGVGGVTAAEEVLTAVALAKEVAPGIVLVDAEHLPTGVQSRGDVALGIEYVVFKVPVL